MSPAPPLNDAREQLCNELLRLAGPHATITEHKERSWASITFAGTRHQIDISFEGAAAVEAGERFITHLPEHLFDIPGGLVADASVIRANQTNDQMTVTVEILLLENDG